MNKKPGQYEFRCKCGKMLFTACGVEGLTVRCPRCKRWLDIEFSSQRLTFTQRIVTK